MLTDQELDDDYEDLRPEMSRRRKVTVVTLGVLIVLVLVAGVVGYWAHQQLFPTPGQEVTFVVERGQSTSTIVDNLEKKGIIKSALLFKWYLKLKGGSGFQAGTYSFPLHDRADDVLRRLKQPLAPPSLRFTVTPGLNLRQIPAAIVGGVSTFTVERLTEALSAGQIRSQFQPAGASLEGFLFPDTYEIGEGANETTAIQTMVTQFDKVAVDVGLQDAKTLVGFDPYEVLIVASLIEEEAKVDVDRPKVARVIYNRLAQGMKLGIDASLCYMHDERPCVLHQSDLTGDSPYNTRQRAGLPPTPIASVSRKALEAALHPDAGDWLYYVLDPDLPPGQHFFTASAQEFEQAKARCRSANLGCD